MSKTRSKYKEKRGEVFIELCLDTQIQGSTGWVAASSSCFTCPAIAPPYEKAERKPTQIKQNRGPGTHEPSTDSETRRGRITPPPERQLYQK